ncbi:MAG: YHS domain-containing protein [Candidatus Omnitrophica bacterium]|nr:YHS domain-containing protein [Candidatus Omnitrophota bacterium]
MFKRGTFVLLLMIGIVSAPVLSPAVAQAASAEVIDVGNSICPLSGDPVNPGFSYVHEGKQYHFCCAQCIKKFKKNPAKYIAAMHTAHSGGGHAEEGHSGHGGEEHAGHSHG